MPTGLLQLAADSATSLVEAVADAPAVPPPGLHLLLGEMTGPAFKNMVRNLAEDRVAIIQAVFEAHQCRSD